MKKFIVAIVLAAAANAFASFSYQGALRNADGSAVTDRNKIIVFRLYESPDASATPLWEGQQAVTISPSSGLFNVEIGDSTPKFDPNAVRTPIDDILARSGDLYIGLEIYNQAGGLGGEIRPRQRILPVPTASFAKNVKQASGDFTVNGNLQVNGAAIVTSNVTFSSDVSVSGKLALQGATTLNGKTDVNGTLSAMAGGKLTEVIPVPVGGIIMWTQSGAPDGEAWATTGNKGHWAICNGAKVNNVQTPDLRNRFVVGAGGSYGIGDTGGTNAVVLSETQIPAHRHKYVGDDNLYYIINKAKGDVGQKLLGIPPGGYDAESDNKGDGAVYETSSVGGSKAHENRPPYYALFYIMRVR